MTFGIFDTIYLHNNKNADNYAYNDDYFTQNDDISQVKFNIIISLLSRYNLNNNNWL